MRWLQNVNTVCGQLVLVALVIIGSCFNPDAARAGITTTPASADYSIAWDGTEGLYFNPANPAPAPWNLARTASQPFGSTAHSSTSHRIDNINDGLYGNTQSWLSNLSDSNPYIGVEFSQPIQFSKIAWSRDNGNAGEAGNSSVPGQYIDRWAGTYTLQYTQAADPSALAAEGTNPASTWANIGTVTLDTAPQAGFNAGYFRHGFDVAYQGNPLSATGLRIKPSSDELAIDEMELYGPQSPPLPTTGLSAWYNAEGGVTTDGLGNVTAWQDLSGNGNNATAGTNAPQLIANSLEGKPVIHFDGASTESLVLPTSSQLGIQNSDYEVFVVGRATTGDVQFYLSSDSKEHYELHIKDVDPSGRFIPRGKTGPTPHYADLPPSMKFTANMPYLYTTRVEDGTGHIGIVGIDSPNTVASAQSSHDVNLALGTRLSQNRYYLTGDIGEVLIYNQKLSSADRQQVERYLMNKWNAGLVLSETGGSYQDSVSPELGFNLALLPDSEAFAQDVISGHTAHAIDHLNDGQYGNGNSWIGGTDETFAGISFGAGHEITAIAFGRDNTGNYDDRTAGDYTLQYTLVADPDKTTPDDAWITLGQITQTASYPDDALGLRHLYRFDPVWATGIRVLTSPASGVEALAIDELEVFGVPEPGAAMLCLVGLVGLAGFRRRRG